MRRPALILTLSAVLLACAGSPQLLFANRKDIRLADASPRLRNNSTVLTGDLDTATSVDYYYEEQYVCWTETRDERIQCGHVNGSTVVPRPVVVSGLQSPDGLACDWIGKKLYWIDSETKRMEVSHLDGRHRKILFWHMMDQPRAVAVNPLSGYLYWTDWGEEPKIERAGMDGDGASRTAIVTTDIHWPNGLSIDYGEGRLYWVDARLGYIHSCELDGGARRPVIASGLPHPFGVSVLDNRVYWTDWRNKSLLSCNKTGRDIRVVLSGLYSPMDVRVYAKERQPPGPNPCAVNNGNCSHLCLMSPSPRRFSCSCPTGIRLLADGRNCATGASDIIFLARRQDLRMISLDTPDFTDVVIEVTNVRHAVAIDYDPIEQFIYWTDDELRAIQRARLDGSEQTSIASAEVLNPDGIAVDWLSRNVFWADAGTDRIEVARLNGSSRRIIIQDGLDEPRALALDPVQGYIYWTDWGKQARIERAAMDGSMRSMLINSSIIWPNGIALDLQDRLLYWADAKLDKIEVAHMDGTDRRELFASSSSQMPHVFGFGLLGDYVYWSDWQQRTIERMLKANGAGRQTVIEQLPDLMGIRVINTNRSNYPLVSPCFGYACSHLCLPRPVGGPTCACPTGMELMANNRTCIVPKAFLLVSEQRDIRRVSLETSNRDSTIPLAGLRSLTALDMHVGQQKIIFADQEQKVINRSFLNGSNAEVVVEFGLQKPLSVAVDWLSDNLYIIDDTRIEAARLNSTSRRVLVWQELESPQSIAVYPERGYMYWSDWTLNQSPRIDVARLDGLERRTLATGTGVGRAASLTIDYGAKRLYWVDIDRSHIVYCVLTLPQTADGNIGGDGVGSSQMCSQPQPLPGIEGSRPNVITVYGDYMYWYDTKMRRIEYANKTSVQISGTVIVGEIGSVSSLAVFHASRQPGYSACRNNNGGCEHFCFTSVEKALHYCACPTHYKIKADNKTCLAPTEFLLIAQRQLISRIADPLKEPDVVLPVRGLRSVSSLGYDPVDGLLYWLDPRNKTIGRSMPDGTNAEVFIQAAAPYDFAIDAYARLLYWTDEQCNCINVTRLNKTPIGILALGSIGSSRLRPTNLVLRSDKGYMFFINRPATGTAGSIIRATMDGKNAVVLVDNSVNLITIAVDPEAERLYWSDGELRTISSCDFAGTDARTLVTSVEATAMSVYGDHLYFVDGSSRRQPGTVARVDKTSGRLNASIRARVAGLTDIYAVRPADHPESRDHPCKKSGCSHICFAAMPRQPPPPAGDSSGAGGYVEQCACPVGLDLGMDLRTCEAPPTCKPIEFTCTSGAIRCLPHAWRCDGQKECADGSDELGCPNRCSPDGSQFACDSGQCIDRAAYCDGIATCVDNSDEPEGGKCCTAQQFMCDDLQCVDKARLCDGARDCADGSDESRCGTAAGGSGGGDSSPSAVVPPREQYTVGIVIVLCIVAAFIVIVVVFVLWKCRRSPRFNEAGLVLRPLRAGSENGDLTPLPSLLHSKAVTATTVLSTSSVSAGVYDRNHITGASSSSSAASSRCGGGGRRSSSGCSAIAAAASGMHRYPGGCDPPPSPVTERSLCLQDESTCDGGSVTSPLNGRCGGVIVAGGSSRRTARRYRGTARGLPVPPTTTPCSTDVCDESEPSVTYRRAHHHKARTRSRKKYRPLAAASSSAHNAGSLPPPPTPARSQVYSMDEASECPPSPSTVRSYRSTATMNPYPPPPSPDCESD